MGVVADRVDHQPLRPWWSCGTCGDPWPCALARVRLRTDFEGFPATLIVYLCAQYAAAVSDLWSDLPRDLYQRVVLWAR